MSDLLGRPKPGAVDPKTSILQMPKHDVCGDCQFGDLVPHDLQLVGCTGSPPTPVVVGMDRNGRPHIEAMRPIVPKTLKACALFKRKSSLVV